MKTKKQIPYIWLGPIITFIIMLVLYAVSGIYPFGTTSTAFADGFSQYLPFLAELKLKITEGSSLLFTWHAGGGINFWATIGYYLASPLNLIALLFPVERMSHAFALITLIKPFFLALTFSIFLKSTYKKNDLSIVIFSILWAMSGFMVGSINFTSWYDAIIYFPLVIMGLKKLMDGGSAWIYSLFLGLTIASNFYVGWMVCIFCVIYFVYCFISDDDVYYEGKVTEEQQDEETEKVNVFAVFQNSYLLKSIFKFAFSSLLAGGISAVLTLPMASILQNTGKGTVSGDTFAVNGEGVLGLLASHIFPFKNTYDTLTSLEYIFMFVGILTLVLVIAYFFAKGISIRKKIGNGFLIAVMWASMLINTLYTAWHGFGEPMGIMYRFAFIYSFVLLKIAFEAFCEIKNIKWYGFLAGAIFAGGCLACSYFNDFINNHFFSISLVIKVALAIVVFTAILILLSKKEQRKTVLTIILLICVISETIIFNCGTFNTFNSLENLSEKQIVDELTENISESDRVHFASKNQEFKDLVQYGLNFGFNAWENYSSLADNDFTLTVQFLGSYGNSLNIQNGASEETPVFNMLFPTKYYIDGTGNIQESVYREELEEKDGYTLYKNNYTMPFMYTISENIANWNPFSFFILVDSLNEVAKSMTETTENVVVYNNPENFVYENCTHISATDRLNANQELLHELEGDHSHSHNGESNMNTLHEYLEKRMDGYSYKVTDMTKPAYITFDSIAETDGMMYLYVDTYELTDLKVTLNGKTTEYYLYGVGNNCTYELGEVKKGDVATITIGGYRENDVEGDEVYFVQNNSFTTTSFTVDMAKFENTYNRLDAMSDTEMLDFEDTYVKAKVISYEDGMLYIPTAYDEGWTITIDGEEVPLYEHESHILMTEISKGEHIVEMKYVPQGFIPGAVITGVSVLILIAWAVISTKRFKKEQESDIIVSNDVNEE